MSESVSNRRRISEGLLEEIESFEGKDFSEKLLRWKNSSDSLSVGHEDSLSVDDVEDAVSRALERDLPELLRREVCSP